MLVYESVSQSTRLKISATIREIAMKFGTAIHHPQTMNHTDFDNPLTSLLVPLSG